MNMPEEAAPKKEDDVRLLKVLTAHFHALVSAQSDEVVLRKYSALLRFLKAQPSNFLEGYEHPKRRTDEAALLPGLSEEVLQRASLDDLEKLINDEGTSRKQLERIAIQRFSVPSGSMRSFSNKQMLVEKLRSLIDNERAHETIGAMARGQTKKTQEE